MPSLTRIQSDMVTDPTSGSKVSDQIGIFSGLIPAPVSTQSSNVYSSYLSWLNDQEVRNWEYGISVKGRKINASGSTQTTTGSITTGTRTLAVTSNPDFIVGHGIGIAGAGAVQTEQDTLIINTSATASGNITITLNGVAFNVAVSAGDSTSVITNKIFATTFTGWTLSGGGTTTVFTANDTGVKTTPSFNAGTTGCTGNMTQSVQGGTYGNFYTVITGINGTTVTLRDSVSQTVTNGSITHDDTEAIQNAINLYNSIFLPDNNVFLVGGLLIQNKSQFAIFGSGQLRMRPQSTNQLIKCSNSNNLYFPYLNLDGNVAQNGVTINQGLATLALYSCYKVEIGKVVSYNPPGDAVYLNDVNDCQITEIRAIADNYTGRNAFTIVKGQRIQIGRIISYKIGTPNMPSGVDLEPNLSTDNINDVTIGELICDSIGSGGLNVLSTNGSTVTRVHINKAIIMKNSTGTGLNACQIMGVSNVKIGHLFVKFTNATGTGLELTNSDHVYVDMDIENAQLGIVLGDTGMVTDFELKGRVRSSTSHNIAIYSANNGVIDMNLKNSNTVSSNAAVCVSKNVSGTSNNIVFRGDFSYGISGAACFFTGASSGVTNWVLDKVDFTGWSADNRLRGTAFIGNVTKINCPNLNFGTSAPIWDTWSVGDRVDNTIPTLVKNISHWKCITGGEASAAVWLAYGCGTGTTAQRPTLGTNDQGYLYHDTTTGTIVMWNGAAWI